MLITLLSGTSAIFWQNCGRKLVIYSLRRHNLLYIIFLSSHVVIYSNTNYSFYIRSYSRTPIQQILNLIESGRLSSPVNHLSELALNVLSLGTLGNDENGSLT